MHAQDKTWILNRHRVDMVPTQDLNNKVSTQEMINMSFHLGTI